MKWTHCHTNHKTRSRPFQGASMTAANLPFHGWRIAVSFSPSSSISSSRWSVEESCVVKGAETGWCDVTLVAVDRPSTKLIHSRLAPRYVNVIISKPYLIVLFAVRNIIAFISSTNLTSSPSPPPQFTFVTPQNAQANHRHSRLSPKGSPQGR